MSKSVKIITNQKEFIAARCAILDAYARAKMCGEVSRELETLRNIYDITFYSLLDDEAKEGLQI